MNDLNHAHILTKVVDELSDSLSYQGLFHQYRDGEPLPSVRSLFKLVDLARAILFPGYFGNPSIHSQTMNYHIGVNVEELGTFADRADTGRLMFWCGKRRAGIGRGNPLQENCCRFSSPFISRLPEIRRILATDVEAAYNGDRLQRVSVKLFVAIL